MTSTKACYVGMTSATLYGGLDPTELCLMKDTDLAMHPIFFFDLDPLHILRRVVLILKIGH